MSNEMEPSAGEQPLEVGKRSLVQRALDATFGYDFFISYTRRDGGKDYAEALARRLKTAGFQIFFDSDEYAMGDDWKVEGKWALRRTSQLILVASPEALSLLSRGARSRDLQQLAETANHSDRFWQNDSQPR